MPERNFADDLKVLVVAYLPLIETLSPVQALVLSQNALYLEMNEAIQFETTRKEEGHDLG